MGHDVRKKFHDYLKSQRLRITQERDDILAVIMKKMKHFTATDIYQELQASGKNIGLATIYRTLPLLVHAGLVREADRRRRKEEQTYEVSAGQDHHDHLICEVCGMMIEFEEPMIEELQERVAEKYGFRLRRHYLDLRGVCADCQKKLMDKAVRNLNTR